MVSPIETPVAKTLNGCTYLLTIRRVRFSLAEAQDFKNYFQILKRAGCEVLIVDGSPAEIFSAHDAIWCKSKDEAIRHVTVNPQYTYLNGKVNGIHTGVALAAHEKIILADDDIRYTHENVRRMNALLSEYEMVRPQNYLRPLPFWARMEAARMLINRAWIREGDYPGTLGITRAAMRRVGHYDGDVLFDNEEIVRHFRVHKAKIFYARDFFVLKRPPSLSKWLEQRPRQAYEDFVMRTKTAFFFLLPIVFIAALLIFGWQAALTLALIVACGGILLAAKGLGDSAMRVFPVSICLYAPLWILERTGSTYWALYWRIIHRGYPFGAKIVAKGTGRAWVSGGRMPLNTNAEAVTHVTKKVAP